MQMTALCVISSITVSIAFDAAAVALKKPVEFNVMQIVNT